MIERSVYEQILDVVRPFTRVGYARFTNKMLHYIHNMCQVMLKPLTKCISSFDNFLTPKLSYNLNNTSLSLVNLACIH